MPWNCPHCGHSNNDFRTNCVKCGTSRYGGGPPIPPTPAAAAPPAPTPPPAAGGIPSGKIQCQNIGCREEYDITEPFCPRCGAPNPRFILQPDQVLCPICKTVYSIDLPTCPKCLEKSPNPRYRLKPGQTKCPKCQNIFDINRPNCPECGELNRAKPQITSIKEATAKGIKGKLYEILMYIIAGIAVMFIPPFFGLPSFRFLGIALMAFMPFYIILPSESAVRGSINVGQVEIPSGKVGLLVTKAMVKLLIFFFVAILELFPLNRLIALIFTFAFYFTMPVSYKESQPYRLIEAWARPFAVGSFLSFLIFMTFSGSGGIANAGPGASLLFMSIAFFVWSFPTHKQEREEGVMKLVVSKKLRDLSQSSGFIAIERYIFFTFMLFAIGMSGLNFGNMLSSSGTTELTFFAVWIISLLSGIVSAPEARPYIGAFMIFIAIFVFTFTYTGVMGQAVFGYWWPQVYAFGESIAAPIAPMWAQVQSGMGDTWLMLTNPMAYYNQMQQKQQATSSVVKTGGTTKSIELTKTDMFTSVTGELEPRLDPLIGSFEIQNQGEFEANKIRAEVWASWKNPTTLNETCTGDFKPNSYSCSLSDYINIETLANNCKELNCSWSKTTYPQEMKVINFVFSNNVWSLGADGNLVDCNDCGNVNETYKHGGQQVKVNVNLTYDYNVNVSIPVEVINRDKYINLLQARQITLQELTSQYTGGPVKATLWSQKQPVRSGELSLFVASIVNEGGGILNNIGEFKVLIPKDLVNYDMNNITIIAQTFQSAAGQLPPNGCGTTPQDGVTMGLPNYYVIDCTHVVPMKSGEYKRVSFFITPENVDDRKMSLIVGLANYEYIKTGSASITVANNPWH